MSLSDCEKCWNTPCTCGYEYKKYSTSFLLTLKEVIDKELDDRKNQHNEDIKPDNPAISNIEYLTVEEMEKIYGIEVTDDNKITDLTIKLPEEKHNMRLVCFLGGDDWYDASVDHLAIPKDCDLEAAHNEYRKWYFEVYCGGNVKYISFIGWLIKYHNARETTDDEIEISHFQ